MTRVNKILVVDDHTLFREGLVSLLRAQSDFVVVGEAGTVSEAVAQTQELAPDIVLMDYSLPDGTGADAAARILNIHQEVKIVFLTIHETDDILFDSIRSGAKGYLLKDLPASKLMEALRGLTRGEAPISRRMTSRILDEFSHQRPAGIGFDHAFKQLTPREVEIVTEVVNGASNSEIAANLFISVNTVKNHIHNILEKLELNDRRELAAFARQHGIKSSLD